MMYEYICRPEAECRDYLLKNRYLLRIYDGGYYRHHIELMEKPESPDYLCNRIWIDDSMGNFDKKCRELAEACTEAVNFVSELGLEQNNVKNKRR